MLPMKPLASGKPERARAFSSSMCEWAWRARAANLGAGTHQSRTASAAALTAPMASQIFRRAEVTNLLAAVAAASAAGAKNSQQHLLLIQ